MDLLLWLIPIFPLAGFLINGLFGRRMSKPAITVVALGSVVLSFAWVLKSLFALGVFPAANGLNNPYIEHYYTWIQSGTLQVAVDFSIDRLSAVMLMIVTGVGTLIHIYAAGYMWEEDSYYRFFAYFNLFMFFMLVLVLAENYVLMFVGWEGVGLCSYLLIGYYFLEKWPSDSGNKAFIVNRIGDFGFTLAVLMIFRQFGTFDFQKVFSAAKGMPVEANYGLLTVICLLLLLGATGKSAQIPLYIWLPDAMAGPTPVSALIHAATMVTAGVYMVARSHVLFMHAPIAMDWVAVIGLATAFFAATIGLTQFDIKKVYAYSTISQLGYMFLGCGVGAFSAGIFHVMTHAFFKALLFLGAGAVIHGIHGEQDLRNMGGLWRKMPIACITLACASLAISGFPGTSGFFSKDEILSAAFGRAPWMYWVGVLTAGMTAFYVFRAWILAFFGKYRGHAHPHESSLVMTIPLMILALLSLGGGFIEIPVWLKPLFPENVGQPHYLVWISSAAGIVGIFLAFMFYLMVPSIPDALTRSFKWVYGLVFNKYYVDEVYNATVVNPVIKGSRTVLWRGVDATVIDGAVNGLGFRARGIGAVLRLAQSGYIRSYAVWVVFGSIILLFAIGLSSGGGR
jgi:NADH-quinone oxidoreductase subunit L